MRFRMNSRLAILATCAVLAAATAPALAIDRQWNVGSGLWSQSANWSPAGIPQPADDAILSFFSGGPGLARVNINPLPAVTSISVSNDNTLLIANQGTLLVGTDLVLGRSSTHGTLNITNPNPTVAFFGGMTVVGSLRLGVQSGVGHVNQNAGTMIVGNDVILGDTRDTSSIFNPAGNYSLTEIGYLRTTNLRVGANANSTGTFNLSGFAHLRVNDQLIVGNAAVAGGRGTFNQSGGLLEAPGTLHITAPSGSAGSTYTLSGGTFDSRLTWVRGPSTFRYTGGTVIPRFLHLSDDARIVITPGGNRVMRAITVTFHSTASSVDVNDNTLELANSGPLATVRDHLARGYNGGSWTGKGITSSTAAAVAASGSPRRTGLGYTFDPSHYYVKYTLMGDTDLDGIVNLSDFNRLAANFGQTNRFWFQGDFNYDGLVNLADFNILAANFGQVATGPDAPTPDDWSNLASAIPEPSALVLSTVLALAAIVRRQRSGTSAPV